MPREIFEHPGWSFSSTSLLVIKEHQVKQAITVYPKVAPCVWPFLSSLLRNFSCYTLCADRQGTLRAVKASYIKCYIINYLPQTLTTTHDLAKFVTISARNFDFPILIDKPPTEMMPLAACPQIN